MRRSARFKVEPAYVEESSRVRVLAAILVTAAAIIGALIGEAWEAALGAALSLASLVFTSPGVDEEPAARLVERLDVESWSLSKAGGWASLRLSDETLAYVDLSRKNLYVMRPLWLRHVRGRGGGLKLSVLRRAKAEGYERLRAHFNAPSPSLKGYRVIGLADVARAPIRKASEVVELFMRLRGSI